MQIGTTLYSFFSDSFSAFYRSQLEEIIGMPPTTSVFVRAIRRRRDNAMIWRDAAKHPSADQPARRNSTTDTLSSYVRFSMGHRRAIATNAVHKPVLLQLALCSDTSIQVGLEAHRRDLRVAWVSMPSFLSGRMGFERQGPVWMATGWRNRSGA